MAWPWLPLPRTAPCACGMSPPARRRPSCAGTSAGSRPWRSPPTAAPSPPAARATPRALGQSAGVQGLAFTPDGRTLASGDWGGTVLLWDVATRTQKGALRTPEDGVAGVAFAPDGRTLAAGGMGGAVRLWDVASGDERTIQ